MKILITGGDGLVGSHFVENYANNKALVLSPSSEKLDITDQNSVEDFFKLHELEVVIHFAAYTDVSKAEEQRNNKNAPSWIINVDGTANLVRAAAKSQIYFIHISTDVVFSGHKDNPGPYPEDYPTEKDSNLLSWYGWTKREAEKLILSNLGKSAIIRISNPVRAKYDAKLDYVRKIVNLYDTKKLYPMFSDQFLTLTFIDEVTESLKILLEKRLSGIYHVSSTNVFTPYKLANYLIEKARGAKEAIRPISIEEFIKDNPYRYPRYGGLKVDHTQDELNIRFGSWKETIDSLIKQLST